uniref:Chondroitin proteoglycan 4 domain-containing protein n=1 Tax=Romanomermis culicivorax TaxID=13658 RepID=A0A915L0Y2_ROMCU
MYHETMRPLSISALLAYISIFIFCGELASAHQPPMFLLAVSREKFLNTTDPIDLCAVQCAESVQTVVETKKFSQRIFRPSIMQQNSTNFTAFFDGGKLTKICNDTSTVVQCVNQCPDRPWKGRMSVLFDPLTYICSGSDLLDHFDCFRNVYRENKHRCEAVEQCQDHREMMIVTGHSRMINTEETLTNVKEFMRHTCNFIECADDCLKSEIIAKCGQKANSQLLQFFHRTMTSIKLLTSLFISTITDSELKFEDTCHRLGAN